MNEKLTISEMMLLPKDILMERCASTLALFPVLREFYDLEFIDELSRHRNEKNYLLFLLAQPEDAIANDILTDLCGDLVLFTVNGAVASFREKFRRTREIDFISARTELLFAARLHRAGMIVEFEPAVGTRRSEFVAERDGLAVHFEIKSLHDLKNVVAHEELAAEVARRLRVIEQPYVLHLEDLEEMTLADCAKAVALLKRELRAHYEAGLAVPQTFRCLGITVKALRSSSSRGYLGSTMGKGFIWQDEGIRRARKSIHGSLKQLPANGANVVVVDLTPSIFLDHDDVFEACFGTSMFSVVDGKVVNIHDDGGIFHTNSHTRISAVISHSRRFLVKRETVVYHNPFARAPLPDAFLAGDWVEQQRFDRSSGKIVTPPPSAAADDAG